jgi:preprotein translocase subunit YajC
MNSIALTTSSSSSSGTSMILMLVIYAVFIALLYFLFFRPQNKRKKEEAKMRDNAQVGDEITTIGGISGRIVAIKEDQDAVILETGTDRVKLRVKRWAIGSVDTVKEEDTTASK